MREREREKEKEKESLKLFHCFQLEPELAFRVKKTDYIRNSFVSYPRNGLTQNCSDGMTPF